MQETANFLPEVLEQLKAGGLLEPAFFNVLPLKDDKVPTVFASYLRGTENGDEKLARLFQLKAEGMQKRKAYSIPTLNACEN